MKRLIGASGLLLGIQTVRAHCPLCTLGAAAAAGGAAYFGVKSAVIGVFIGAFAVSTGWWVSRLIKKQYIPYQLPALILFSFIATILPMLPMFSGPHDVYGWYVSLAGSYGSFLNRTYIINLFLVGSLLGGSVVSVTPWLSKKITEARQGKMIPYQGILLTFGLLLLAGLVLQFTF
ncbi:MAG: hypothetical protein GXP63_06790 [DPANN group archaeon]|nr:hypothetical protein [DPANN group archaeon]